ncbi:hypothetical protein CMK19_21800 [Candidatus Poribacteria bacterium]|nr:hypothetical protein [Candidatus Poribacteria bacterium]|tara:strand:+ start:8177 stop:8524 length:348 start_codon:yes stop_codon:yes gene_type:complete
MRTVDDVFDHHIEVFGVGDLKGILTDYDSNSAMLYKDRIWHGVEGAKQFFCMWLEDLMPPGSAFELISRLSHQQTLYITWRAETDKYIYDFGTNTFIVRDDKIWRQTVAAHIRVK